MAFVTSIEPGEPKKRPGIHPTQTHCLYCIFDGPSNERYLQLDTAGSKNREFPGKISQSMQFDRQMAGRLLQILHRAFPDLAQEPS